MKQNVRNLKQQKIYRRRRIALAVVLIVIVALLVAIYASTSNLKTADVGNSINLKGVSVDISKVISADPNPPVVGAGMIPIKWDENQGLWVITTADDKDWYNYSEGKWANVMLSNRSVFIRIRKRQKTGFRICRGGCS